MGFIGWLVMALVGYYIYRKLTKTGAEHKPDVRPGITVRVSTVYDTQYTPQYIQSCVLSINQYLIELENAHEEWIFGYHPEKIEREVNNILKADAGHSFALKIKAQLPAMKRDCQTRYLLFRVRHLSEKAEAAVAVSTKQKYATESLQLLENGIQEGVADAARLKEHIPRIRSYIAQVEIDDFIEKAKRFEFKGNKKKALEYFKDAYYSAINDNIPDEQQREVIDWLSNKIEDLEGVVTLEQEKKKPTKKLPPPEET
ncbi:MAG: hypothetical protein KKH74_01775 [Gammaproteobacteria bacterium]|nr:hypothetical protein [Gammaproteobacteria bacterium]MBU1731028.1 hypothetical protein [Gammaproteobacteria bacterium]MBU1893688.1 hypothetical protein [Gammaproteobacteria bacterium]